MTPLFTEVEQQLKQRLADLAATHFELIDESAKHRGHSGNQSGGCHLQLVIASPIFTDKPTQACHRLIYEKITRLIPYPIHALGIKIIR